MRSRDGWRQNKHGKWVPKSALPSVADNIPTMQVCKLANPFRTLNGGSTFCFITLPAIKSLSGTEVP
jgi:hypothetical protein